MATYRIPYESLDPLTIGASGDDSKLNRDELELEIPDANILAAIYPDEPEPVGRRHAGCPGGARVAGHRATLLRAPRRQAAACDRDRQPVPADAAVEAAAGGLRRGRGRRASRRSSSARTARSFPCPSRTSSRRSDARTSPAWSGWGSSSSRTSHATRRCTSTSASPRAARPCGCTRRSRAATSS